jgi:two-component system sporulation sensor kinase B
MIRPLTYSPQSWLLALAAMAFGLGLYHFDNWYETMAESWIKTLLDDLEIEIMGPGMALLVLLVSENVRLKDQAHLRRLERERESRFAMLGRLAASVAHEVRNPLHNLRLIDEELRVEAPPSCKPLIDRVEANLARLDQAVALAYELARPNRKVDDSDIGELRLVELVEASVKETARRIHRELAVDHRIPAEAVLVNAREAAMRIILDNLIRNAVEAAGPGTVAIGYRRQEAGWLLTIANPGSLPATHSGEDDLEPSAKPDGLGVGLSIVRHLARNLGATFRIGSDAGRVVAELGIPLSTRENDG